LVAWWAQQCLCLNQRSPPIRIGQIAVVPAAARNLLLVPFCASVLLAFALALLSVLIAPFLLLQLLFLGV
jgi:hypothetical protein